MSACLHGCPETDCFVCAAPSPWCTTREAAGVIERTAMRVAQLCRAGLLDAQMMSSTHGDRWRITRVSVLEYVRTHPRQLVEGGRPALPDEPVLPIPRKRLPECSPILGRWQKLPVEQFAQRVNQFLASL